MKNFISAICIVIFLVILITSCSKSNEIPNVNLVANSLSSDEISPAPAKYTFVLHLYGFKVIPTNSSLAHAVFTFKFDGEKTAAYTIECKGIFPTVAEIHRGTSRENGPLEFDLEIDKMSPYEGTIELNESQVNDLMNGKLYVDIHSKMFPEGEIRAQIGKE